MYLKLNNYEYKITAANVGFEMSEVLYFGRG